MIGRVQSFFCAVVERSTVQGGRWDGAASYTLHLWLGSLALQFTVTGRRPSSSWRWEPGDREVVA